MLPRLFPFGAGSWPLVCAGQWGAKPDGTNTPVLFVGGGDDNFYALNATSGSILWKTALGSSPDPYDSFIWSSPALYKGSVYVGVASFGDCPDVQGQLVQLNATTGAIQHTFDVEASGMKSGDVGVG